MKDDEDLKEMEEFCQEVARISKCAHMASPIVFLLEARVLPFLLGHDRAGEDIAKIIMSYFNPTVVITVHLIFQCDLKRTTFEDTETFNYLLVDVEVVNVNSVTKELTCRFPDKEFLKMRVQAKGYPRIVQEVIEEGTSFTLSPLRVTQFGIGVGEISLEVYELSEYSDLPDEGWVFGKTFQVKTEVPKPTLRVSDLTESCTIRALVLNNFQLRTDTRSYTTSYLAAEARFLEQLRR
jgi:hypothetical protein